MKAADLGSKSKKELHSALLEKREELFKLRMQRGSGQLSRPDLMKKARRDIARIKTAMNQKSEGEN
jgi:large subunit ribosomal protein L29